MDNLMIGDFNTAAHEELDADKLYQASEVANLTGATLKQLRDWDEKGILSPARAGEHVANNRKLYTADEVEIARTIVFFRELDMPLAEIKQMLLAPDEERAALLGLYSERLKRQHDQLERWITLAGVAEMFGLSQVHDQAKFFGGYDRLAASYDNNENLKQVIRWLHSHTERDVEKFWREFNEICTGFAKVADDPSWDSIELELIKFCDMWSKRFGWPTVGGMLSISFMLATDNDFSASVKDTVGEDVLDFMCLAFLIAWTKATLESIDATLTELYMSIVTGNQGDIDDDTADRCKLSISYDVGRDSESLSLSHKQLQETAEILIAIVAECGGNVHLVDVPPSVQRTEILLEISQEMFELLEEMALDDDMEEFIDLDEYPAIDGPALALAQAIADAHAQGNLEGWLDDGGASMIESSLDGWLDMMHELWADSTKDEEQEQPFVEWLQEWVADVYPDFPEASWATYEESCFIERSSREHLEHALRIDDV